MSLLPTLRTIVNNVKGVTTNVSVGVRASLYGSSRPFSKDIEIDITNPHAEDLPIELDKNPFEKSTVECILCKHNIIPNYKNIRLLSQFQSRYTGRIYGRNITGLCKKKQKLVESNIRRAQSCGLMPFMTKNIEYVNDPELFDPDNPIRPHPY